VFHKLSTVKRWIDQCVAEWVVEGRSFRELSTSERLSRMSANLDRFGSMFDARPASKRETYLPPINVAGEKEVMPRSEVWTAQRKYECLVSARELCAPTASL